MSAARWRLWAALALLGATGTLAACGGATSNQATPGADPQRGHGAIVYLGCGACHIIGGVNGADGTVGPSLRHFSQGRFIAGQLPRTPSNAVRWIVNPPAIDPKTIMPNLGVSVQQARDIVAYLYSQ